MLHEMKVMMTLLTSIIYPVCDLLIHKEVQITSE